MTLVITSYTIAALIIAYASYKVATRNWRSIYYKDGRFQAVVKRLKKPVLDVAKNIELNYDYILKSRVLVLFIPVWVTEERYQFSVPKGVSLKEMVDENFNDWYDIQVPLEDINHASEENTSDQKENVPKVSTAKSPVHRPSRTLPRR